VRRRAVAVVAALALVSGTGCAPSPVPVRDDTATAIARAVRGDPQHSGNSGAPSALPPATLEVVFPATPLRGANGLACFERRVAVAEALGNRVVLLSADAALEPVELPAGLSGPDDLLRDSVGALVVTATRSGEVWRRAPGGGWSKLASDLPGVNAVAQTTDGRLFVSTCAPGGELYEISATGGTPRRIASGLGCADAMVADGAGTLVAPLVDRGSVVRISVDHGSSTTIASGLAAPKAVRRAPDGSLVVLEAASGVIRSLGNGGPIDGRGATIAQLDPGLDDFVVCGESVVVSNFLTGEIVQFKPWPASPRVLEPPGLAAPSGLVATGDDVLVSDGVSIRRLREGGVRVLVATVVDPVPPPFSLALAPGGLAWTTVPHHGEVHRVDLAARTSEKVVGGLDWPTSIVAGLHGAIVADAGAGRIVEIGPEGSTRVLASGLAEPLAVAVRGGQILTIEPEGGRLLGFREGTPPALVASGLAEPVGLASDARGRIFIAEARTGYVIRMDADGSRTRIAQGFDFRRARALRAPVPMAVDAAGDLLIAVPESGSVLRVRS